MKSVLYGKKILLGITGGIAAYKTAFLVRILIKAGAEVKVVMTPTAKDFITPLTLSTLSKNPVVSDFTNHDEENNPVWNNHVELALWADLLLIAPATANTLSKMANGNCDSFLLAAYLSATCPVYFAPAMDLDMYKHPTTLNNFSKLALFGNIMIPAEKGELASGLYGEGRMAEPEHIVSFLEEHLSKDLPLKGKNILITAGPTFEPIDPVRFVGNHASGKMGFALARQASRLGAEVTLVTGPTALEVDFNAHCIRITTAEEMFLSCEQYFDETDVFIASAAVADYRPKEVAQQKIKKNSETYSIEMVKTVDVLKTLSQKKEKQFLVGFALETENEMEHALEKIHKKNLDLMVMNSLNDQGAGFGHDTNKVTLLDAQGVIQSLELQSKDDVARDILNHIIQRIHA